MPVRNKVQLITYPDSMGGDLASLDAILEECFPGLFEGGIHILPPYPSSGDRGFSPLTYAEIDPAFGGWEDLRRLGKRYDILLDLMVNHISRQSAFFGDFLENGRKSEWADLFMTLDKVWPDGIPREADVSRMFLRRPLPYSSFVAGGREERVWTTFGKQDPSEQVDMDWRSPLFRRLITEFFGNFADNGIKTVRLDAVGYLVKKVGTSCFFVEPEIFEFMEWIGAMAGSLGIDLLPEVHAPKATQYRLAGKGYWIYDFILPYTVLEAILDRTAVKLKSYLADRPERQFTMLDCHDGIPVKPDMEGLYGSEDARRIVAACLERGGNLSLVHSPRHKDTDGFDVHQIRGSFYSLLDRNDDAYLAARAIQFFVPGVPQVYYVGLLAGEHDREAVERTGEGREINRHNFGMDEIRSAAGKDVVKRLVRLIRFRNAHPAFDGTFRVPDTPDDRLELEWSGSGERCTLYVDFRNMRSRIRTVSRDGAVEEFPV